MLFLQCMLVVTLYNIAIWASICKQYGAQIPVATYATVIWAPYCLALIMMHGLVWLYVHCMTVDNMWGLEASEGTAIGQPWFEGKCAHYLHSWFIQVNCLKSNNTAISYNNILKINILISWHLPK